MADFAAVLNKDAFIYIYSSITLSLYILLQCGSYNSALLLLNDTVMCTLVISIVFLIQIQRHCIILTELLQLYYCTSTIFSFSNRYCTKIDIFITYLGEYKI